MPRLKKKTAFSLGVLAAGALALCSWFSGAVTPDANDELSVPAVVSTDTGADDGGDGEQRRTARTRALSQPALYAIRTAVLLPVTLGIRAAGFLLRRLCDAALLPVLHFLGGWAFAFLVLLSFFCVLYKLLFPERRLREFLRWKNLRWILLGSFFLPGADAALRLWCEDYHYLRAALMTLLLCGIILFLWLRCFASALGARGRLRALLLGKRGWALPVLLLAAAVLYGWCDANVSHETLQQNLTEALWLYTVTAAAVGAIAVHRLQKRAAIRQTSAGGTSPAA